MKLLTLTATAAIFFLADANAAPPPPVPEGLWQNSENGSVMRIEPCGDALCGFAVGVARNEKPRPDTCGKQLLKNFQWDPAKKHWHGKMQPPNFSASVNGTVTLDSKNTLVLRGKMLFVTKTITLQRFLGKVTSDCIVQ